MASILKLEDNIIPSLTGVHRVGAPNNLKRQGPRNIIATFLTIREKVAFMREARKRCILAFKEEKVEIYQDLPPEALALCRELKPVMQQLRTANKRYCWIRPSKLQLSNNGTLFQAAHLDSGLILLHALDLKMQTEFTKCNTK